MWLVYNEEDSIECGFEVGNGTEKDCIDYCKEHDGYTYTYVAVNDCSNYDYGYDYLGHTYIPGYGYF